MTELLNRTIQWLTNCENSWNTTWKFFTLGKSKQLRCYAIQANQQPSCGKLHPSEKLCSLSKSQWFNSSLTFPFIISDTRPRKKTCLQIFATMQDSNQPARLQRPPWLRILDIATIGIVLGRLIRLHRCVSVVHIRHWCLLFTYGINRFSHDSKST